MPGLITVCHSTLGQRLWGQHPSAGEGVGIPTPQQILPLPYWHSPHLAATGTARSKLVLIAGHAVVSILVGHKGTRAQWLLTATAQETVLMPCLASILQLPGPCGEQESHSDAVFQALRVSLCYHPHPRMSPLPP